MALQRIREILDANANLTPQIVALLDDYNWRPQLVGAVTMGLGVAGETSRDALWHAFDSGSWVSPRLAVIAFLVDENFEAQARMRMEAGCPNHAPLEDKPQLSDALALALPPQPSLRPYLGPLLPRRA